MNQLEIAKNYAKSGIKVFPCNPKTKSPLTKNGFKEATTDLNTIEKWWNKHTDALVGAPNEKFTVLDVDCHGLCQAGQILTDKALEAIEKEGITKCDTLKVRTLSGGIHYYFKHEDIQRSIKALPNIDILGNGGYTILPDQVNYVCETSETPWEAIKNLKKLNTIKLSMLTDEYEELTKTATLLKKASKGQVSTVATKKSAKVSDSPSFTKKESEGLGNYKVKMDYTTGELKFIVGDGVYNKSTNTIEKQDPKQKLLHNGKIKLTKGNLNQEMILAMFYNVEIQKKLGEHLGLKVPAVNASSKQRSVLPGHLDRKPSMSVRWVEENHLVARDHSNHFNDSHQQVDYDLIRLYTTQVYKSATPRFSTGERNMWFLKLMHEANLLDVSDLEFEYYLDDQIENLTPSEKKVLEGYKLLYMLKSSYVDFDGFTAFSDRFTAGWCEVSPATANNAKNALIAEGFFAFVDTINCHAEDKGFNLRSTRGLKPISKDDDYEVLLNTSHQNEVAFQEGRERIFKSIRDSKEEVTDQPSTLVNNEEVKTVRKGVINIQITDKTTVSILDRIRQTRFEVIDTAEDMALRYLSTSHADVDESPVGNHTLAKNDCLSLYNNEKLNRINENRVNRDKLIQSKINLEKIERIRNENNGIVVRTVLVHRRPVDKYYHHYFETKGASP